MRHNDPGLQVQYRMTHYISSWRNGDCQLDLRQLSMWNERQQPRKTLQSGLTFLQAGKLTV
jgi:hypothetical protein